ncbi:Si-specific NAD(P)(+) transhydrogenase [Desulfuromonas carbonis]|uniref:Si-specific NAD(P)(+) transhydrogenase n=1 Tax=Desulfuromonas sp. DDH964 TaxID=1823759 RepID=UPI00078BE9D7|nr:Si-specific NAD(P)(+) transhydrogenase [Desulfuromonas sp. DDH964]AMV73618.1 dihydrolipoamide dehydrogenase [Desulfuromonas sp. DDH964]
MDGLKNHFEAIVIGSGPGGEGASIALAKAGKSVAVVEKYPLVGGGCTHWGTIPSKTLIHVIRKYAEEKNSPFFDRAHHPARVSAGDLLAAVQRVVDQQVRDREGFYERNAVEVIEGEARFVDPHTVLVLDEAGNARQLSADHFVIATGSHPYRPDDVDFSTPRLVDSDTILQLRELPATLTVYGAGVIGCEYASAFRDLGVKVNLVNTRQRLLEFLDEEISNALSYHMRDEQGILIRQSEEYERVEVTASGVVLHLKTGKVIKSDMLLWANGRTGNSSGLGLAAIGLRADHRGHLAVNEVYQTSHPHIYAVGDIVGFPNLASAAYDQGRFAGTHIATGHCDARLVRDIPTGIYSTPEISSLGRTEQDLTAEKIPYEVGHSFFKHLARGQITSHKAGMLKLLFHRETLEILGIHCFGHNAAEILHIGQAIMAQPAPYNSVKYFINTTFNYPTMAEAYRVAALNGCNRL